MVSFGVLAGDDAPAGATSESEKEKPEKKPEESPKEYRNWFDVSVGGVIVSGNQAQYQSRYGVRKGAFGGVEDFHYEEDVGKKGLFHIDGHGIFDNHDYSVKLGVEHPEIGYLEAGYREFRTWSDGSGGFFPGNNGWYPVFDDALALDRGEAWFKAGLTLPNLPVFEVRYTHQFRKGQEDSTSWGDVNIPGYGSRAIVPSFRNINETRDIFSGEVKHTVGQTDFGLGLRYEVSSTDNSLNLRRNPGQPGDRYVTQRDGVDTDLFNMHAFVETVLSKKVLLTMGYSFTTLDSDISGYRLYGTAYDPDFAQRLPSPDTYQGVSGGSQLNQHVANLNVMLRLTDHLVLIPALRVEKQDTDSASSYDSPAAPFSSFPYQASSDRGLLDVSESLELRYTGLTNWVFYIRPTWLEGSGDLSETWDNLGTGGNVVRRSTDDDRFWQKYPVGARWYPLKGLNFSAEYYHKIHENDYNHIVDSTPNTLASIPISVYPAFLNAQKLTTDDANFRVAWRPLATLSLVGRYDFQFSTIDTLPDNLSKIQSSEMVSHIVSCTISWTPVGRLYLQAGVNRVWDKTDTPGDEITPAIQDAKNNYWTVTCALGYALDNKTDLELQYLFYRADNYADNSAYGLPYGASAQENGITAGLNRRVSDRIQWTLKYGFFDGRDTTSGHYNDYQAHLVSTSFRYRF
ncbi:MAG: TonB-dependent receptor [Verrucomicrobiota bacterium]